MGRVPESQEIVVESFKKEDQEVASKIAGPFNNFSMNMIQAINNSLTISENMLGETRSFVFNSTSLQKTFKYNGGGTPKLLWIGNINKEPTTAIMPYWSQDGKGNITVKIIGTLAASTDYTITFIILGG